MHFLFLLLWPSVALAKYVYNFEYYGIGGQSLYACGYAMTEIGTFCEEADTYECFCTNDNAKMTMTGCLAVDHRNTTAVYKYYAEYCRQNYYTDWEPETLVELHEKYLVEAQNSSEIENFNVTVPVDVPLLILNTSYVHTMNEAYKVFLGNYDHSTYYGAGSLGYWALIALIAMVCNWGVVIFPLLRDLFNGTFSKMFRKYITLPALGKRKKNVHQSAFYIFDFLIPSRLESAVIFGFFWFLFVVCAVEIYYVKGDQIFLTKEEGLTRYISDRTGIVCTILTPLLLLFGGRNNFLQWVTRWKFSTMITYHRWIARMVVAMAFIHSVGYTWMYVTEGYYAEEMKEEWLIWGVVATTCGCLICFQALLFLRRRAYEVFLILHILLAGFWIIGMWFHVCVMGYSQFMYSCFAVWGFDRFVRAIRVLWFGFPKAEISLTPDETLKVEVPKPKHWPTVAGGHAWIHFMQPLTFWQNHPFTFIDSVEKKNTIVFYCKVKKGITQSLCKKLQNFPGKSTTMRVAVEGPYGETCPVSNHSSSVYIAGGSGIPGIYSEAVSMAKRSKDSTRKTKLIWIVREIATVAGFLKELTALKHLNIETVVYITREVLAAVAEEFFLKTDLSSLEKDKEGSLNGLSTLEETFPHIEFRFGRPDLKLLIVEEITEAASSVAFVTCGHPLLVDDLRYHVVEQIDHTSKRLDFYEQLQVWA